MHREFMPVEFQRVTCKSLQIPVPALRTAASRILHYRDPGLFSPFPRYVHEGSRNRTREIQKFPLAENAASLSVSTCSRLEGEEPVGKAEG